MRCLPSPQFSPGRNCLSILNLRAKRLDKLFAANPEPFSSSIRSFRRLSVRARYYWIDEAMVVKGVPFLAQSAPSTYERSPNPMRQMGCALLRVLRRLQLALILAGCTRNYETSGTPHVLLMSNSGQSQYRVGG